MPDRKKVQNAPVIVNLKNLLKKKEDENYEENLAGRIYLYKKIDNPRLYNSL